MMHVQAAAQLAAPRPLPPPRRPLAPWSPAEAGPYRLPREAHDRLTTALAGRKNREAAFALAVFLARFWTTPDRLLSAFAVDRRALAGHEGLGLSEDRIRGALGTLEAIGFLDRVEPAPGKRYQRTAEGLHRKPILFRFGADYGPTFARANARTQAARQRETGRRRSPAASSSPHPQRVPPVALPVPLPQIHHGSRLSLDLGEEVSAPDTPLEAALTRWRQAVEAVTPTHRPEADNCPTRDE